MDLQINKISSKEDEVRKTFSDAISYCTELLRRKKYYDDVENDTMSRQSALLGQKFFEILQNARNELLAEETKLNDKKTPISSRVNKEKKSTNKKIDSTDKIKETVSKYFDSTYKQRAAVTKADKNLNNNVIEINDIADESVEDNLNNTLENLIDKNTDDVCTSNKNNTGDIVVQQVDKNSTGIIDNQIKQNSTGIINNQIEKESTGIIDDKIEKESTGIIHQIEKESTGIIDDKIEKESTGIINHQIEKELTSIIDDKIEKESTGIINNHLEKESTGIINNQIVKESTGIINNQIVKESTGIINHQIEKKSTGIIDDKIAKNLTAVINEKIRETVNAMVNQDKENMCVKNTNINANCPDKNVAEKQDNTQHVNEKISLVNKDQAVTKQIVINENKQSPEQSNSINNNVVVIKTEPVDCPDENDEVSSTMFKSPTVPPLVPVTTEDGLRKIKKELVSSTSDNEFYSNRTIITRKSIMYVSGGRIQALDFPLKHKAGREQINTHTISFVIFSAKIIIIVLINIKYKLEKKKKKKKEYPI
ncbi:hypothetical protein HCN44_004383 [Aphidius gifuensis]|uniref:Uncharacterized protein n=1 Tax=Aphidius gifuensis TaxID=684658 RepID=A0A834XZ34_APHGI|nr:hypothetical protein HCN44_004383 [Aphidius gifuensis]